jgi:TfoX/Sxy family transcriptional regulator of competence genes
MAADESLAARIRDVLARTKNVEERTLFGCACFFLNGNVLVGVWNDALIARVGRDEGEAALREPHVRAFDITGKPMRNWVVVEPEGVEDDDQLRDWVRRAEEFVGALPAKRKDE